MTFLRSNLYGSVCLTVALAACSSHRVATEKRAAPTTNAPTLHVADNTSNAHGAAPDATVPTELSGISASTTAAPAPTTAAAPAATAPAHHSERGPVSADKALLWMKHGNTRFVHQHLRNDGERPADRARLVSGQKPHTIVLSCSDSRVPPEVVFDQKLGEIFVIRTAGESLDYSAIASIEYAIEHLGSNLILVMGHESCGAVKASLATLSGADAGSPALNKLVADLHPHLRSFAGAPVSEGAIVEVWANTEGVAKDLVQRSQIVRDALNTGEVKIQTALYHLGSGVVEFR